MCGAGRYLCGRNLCPPSFHLEHKATNEQHSPRTNFVFGLTPEWMPTDLWASVSTRWTELDQGLPCHGGVGWADGVGGCDWERCHSTCGHSPWRTPRGAWIMYTVVLSDGWCNNARQNGVTRNPSDSQHLNQPTNTYLPRERDVFSPQSAAARSLECCC